MKIVRLSLFCFLAPVIVACTTLPTDPKGDGPLKQFEFDSFVEKNLGPVTLTTRPPKCGTWLSYLRGVVKAESGWKKDAVYKENFKDRNGDYVLSVGYFQLSTGDKNNYKTPYCQKLTSETLKDPETNTGCALEIIETLLKRGRPLGAYWSTMRPQNEAKVKCNG